MQPAALGPLNDIVEIGVEDRVAREVDTLENIVAIGRAHQSVNHLVAAVEMRDLVFRHKGHRPVRIESRGQYQGPRGRDRRQNARDAEDTAERHVLLDDRCRIRIPEIRSNFRRVNRHAGMAMKNELRRLGRARRGERIASQARRRRVFFVMARIKQRPITDRLCDTRQRFGRRAVLGI